MATRRILPTYPQWLDDAKQVFEQDSTVEVLVEKSGFSQLDEVRRTLFHTFTWKRIDRINHELGVLFIVIDENIRTHRLPHSTSKVEIRPTKSKTLEGFNDAESLSQFPELSSTGTCACCGKELPLTDFYMRRKNGRYYKGGYCKRCHRLYDRWRDSFLREHGAKYLVATYTEGHKRPNELFRAWFQAHQGE